MTTNDFKIGVSACLLGQKVRYDGGHKLDRFITDTLGQYVSFVPVCPEAECGLGIPRESMHLEGEVQAPRLVTSRTKKDVTDQMLKWAKLRLKELQKDNLCGFIFKSKSPSSGMERVNVFNEKGMPVKKGSGLFAAAFMRHFPLIPVEDDGRLHDPKIRENFIERIFTLQRWRRISTGPKRIGDLIDFHTRHKLLILSHNQNHYRFMGKLVATAKDYPPGELFRIYEAALLEALKHKTTQKKNANVLQHLMGYFKKQISADEKQEMLQVIDQYRAGHVPLVVPVTLINHYVRKFKQPYLSGQFYLQPHPVALQLRNHV
jgi:uncharacterized protein YbgA (DUF1722 family)/uncharacterized protein YbbK (DUF523 family)